MCTFQHRLPWHIITSHVFYFLDDWIFPDSFQDVSKLSDTLHQTYISNLCEQLADNSQSDSAYPEERTPGDPDNIFTYSSMSGSVHHGQLQGQSSDRDTVSPEVLEHDRRGARMEDDFYGNDNSIEVIFSCKDPTGKRAFLLLCIGLQYVLTNGIIHNNGDI